MRNILHLTAAAALALGVGPLCSDLARAADWTDVGAAGKPAWVDATAERRLRLLPALPGIAEKINSLVKGYFGSQGPGLAVGLVLDDGLYYSQGFGLPTLRKRMRRTRRRSFALGLSAK